LKFRFHLFAKSRSSEISRQNEAAASLHNILLKFRSVFGLHSLGSKFDQNSVFLIILENRDSKHKILNLLYLFYKCIPTISTLELRELTLWTIAHQLEKFKYNEMPYTFSNRVKLGGFGIYLSPNKEQILLDKDDVFGFKTIVITFLANAWTQNKTSEHSTRQCNHIRDPRLISDLSTNDKNFYRVVTAVDSFNFVTCHGVLKDNDKVSSDTEFIVKYGKPFDKVVWLFMGSGIILITCFSGCVRFIFKRLP